MGAVVHPLIERRVPGLKNLISVLTAERDRNIRVCLRLEVVDKFTVIFRTECAQVLLHGRRVGLVGVDHPGAVLLFDDKATVGRIMESNPLDLIALNAKYGRVTPSRKVLVKCAPQVRFYGVNLILVTQSDISFSARLFSYEDVFEQCITGERFDSDRQTVVDVVVGPFIGVAGDYPVRSEGRQASEYISNAGALGP